MSTATEDQLSAELADVVLPPEVRLDSDWPDKSLCPQTDPEVFFPDKGESTREVKRVCAVCPVALECLITALGINDGFAVCGGYTAHQRRKLRQSQAARQAAVDELVDRRTDTP